MKNCLPLLFVFTLPLHAQNFLDPLIVTATRSATPIDDVPYSSNVFSEEFLWENTVRTLPDALRYTPGVLVQKTANGHGSPFIRGFTGRQNLLMIDGVRFNNSTFRGGPIQYWNTVDPYSLERFELVRSQGSVLYGSDAVGGTVNAFTKGSGFLDEEEGKFYTHGSALYEYRSNGEGSNVGRIETQTGVGGKFGFHLGISVKDFGDIEDDAVGLMDGTGYPEESIDARFDYALSKQNTLTAAYQYLNQDDISRWHSTLNNPGWTHGKSVAAPGTFIARTYDQERAFSYLRFSHENDQAGAPVKRLTATLSYQTSSDNEFQIRSLTDLRSQSYDVDTIGLDLEFESDLAGGSLLYGVDYYHDKVDSTGARDPGTGFVFDPSFRPVADDSDYDLLGVYGQYIRPLGDRFEVTAGARYTYAQAELGKTFDSAAATDVSADDSWSNLSASLRATYRITSEWLAYGGISQAFRAPNLNDLSGNLTSRSGSTSVGALGVDPEKFVTAELGIRKDGDTWGMSSGIFYTDIRDIITGVPDAPGSGTEITTNGSDGYVYGVEFEGYWNLSRQWTLSGFASWQDGQMDIPQFIGGPTTEEYVSRLLPLSGSIALRWHHETIPVWVEGRVLASANADHLSSSDKGDTQRIPVNGTPSYGVLSLRAGYDPNEHLQLTAAIENLTDEDYRIHGSGQNEPGLGAILGMRVIW